MGRLLVLITIRLCYTVNGGVSTADSVAENCCDSTNSSENRYYNVHVILSRGVVKGAVIYF